LERGEARVVMEGGRGRKSCRTKRVRSERFLYEEIRYIPVFANLVF
jgi:hypothetical protein